MGRSAYEEKEINGVKYIVRYLPPFEALALLTDLGKVLGPALAPVIDNAMDSATTKNSIGDAIRILFEKLEASSTKSIILRLCKSVTVVTGGKEFASLDTVFEAHFSEQGLGVLVSLLPFIVQVQYKDFLDSLRNVKGSLDESLTTKV